MGSEKSITLPPASNNAPIDIKILVPLWSEAILETVKGLQHLEPDTTSQKIHRPDAGGYNSFIMNFPIYRDGKIWDEIYRASQENGKNLANYLWDCGKPKLTLGSGTPGSIPDRADWNEFAIFHLIFNPILKMLEDSAINQLVRDGSFKPWVITPEQVSDYVSKAGNALKNDKIIIKAYCPLNGIKLEGVSSARISKHIYLKAYTPEERCVFLSKHSIDFLWDDFNSPIFCDSMAEMEYEFDKEEISKERVVELITDDLDLVKLCIFILNEQIEPVDEGTCILNIIGRDFLDIPHKIKRLNESTTRASGVPNQNLPDKDLPALVEIISVIEKTSHSINEIKNAIWHFGRACLTPLPRDIILESVIGLEGLLVQRGAELRYRFSLHGAILLADEDEKIYELFEQLKDLYDKRSSAAHSGSGSESLGDARDARMRLSKAIYNIVRLFNVGKLPCKDDSGKPKKLADSLQTLVIKKSSLTNEWIRKQYPP